MSAGQSMRHITLHLMQDALPQASLLLAELSSFVPDNRALAEETVPDIPGQGYRESYNRARALLDRLLPLADPSGHAIDVTGRLHVDLESLNRTTDWLEQAWQTIAPCNNELIRARERLHELDGLEESVVHVNRLGLSADQLQQEHRYLNLLVGTVPVENVQRLRESLQLNGHLIVHQIPENELVFVVIAGPRIDTSPLDSVLSAAGFRHIDLPPQGPSDPAASVQQVDQKRRELKEQIRLLEQQINAWRETNADEAGRARLLLELATPFTVVRDASRHQGTLATTRGWLPANRIDDLAQRLQTGLKQPFVLEQRRPRPDEYGIVPIPPVTHRWLHPFAGLVRQYGVPRFGEFDPTWLFAFTFAAMFGMMFGDIGHGAVFIGLGIALRRRLGEFWIVFVAAGTMAVVFGFLYGSVFGIEHWLQPIWISPLTDPLYMLSAALIWGIAFLTLGSAIIISNHLLDGDAVTALFDAGGVFSLLLYWALLGGLYTLIQGDGFHIAATLIIMLCLSLLIGYRWRESDAPLGERILTVAVETFEIVNGYVAKSLSFLRLAAFSLNHVALSMAVFTLADLFGTTGHWVTLILGNIFIIVLEGIIVAIQTLRLEYYEGFSRYFHGDGQPYRPLRLRLHTSPSSRGNPA